MSSANQTISPSGLKTLVVAKGKGNGVGWSWERDQTGEERDRMGGIGSDGGNGV